MSESEYRIADGAGKFLQAVKAGNRLKDANWTSGRIVLSNRRLILASNDGKRAIPLSHIAGLNGRFDVNQTVAQVSEYVTVSLDNGSVLLVSLAEATEEFEHKLYGALLDQREVSVKHPAVSGGVVQNTSFERARVKVEEDQLSVALATGSFVPVDLNDVGSVGSAMQERDGETKPVVKVEHSRDGTSLQTHFSGDAHTCAILESLFREGAAESQGSIDLSQTEKRVLMALYSGVSSFEIPDFLGMGVDEVEEIFERLLELDVLDEVRKRREVTLKTRGRNIASEAINEE